MLCERCKKNEATFHKAIYINGKGYETNLCSDCARELNFNDDLNFDFDDFTNDFNYLSGGIFDEFFNDNLFFSPTMLLEKSDKKCPECGSTFSDFLRRGRLGCSTCYETFNDEIRDMLENMDNPTDFNLDIGSEIKHAKPTKLQELQDKFNKAIEEERYEDAGEIKKQINQLRDENKEDK